MADTPAFFRNALNLPSRWRDQIPGDFGEGVVNNFSLLTADRITHVKVVAVALVCAMVGIGLAARLNDQSALADARLEATVIKAGKPVTASTGERSTIR